MLKHNNTISGKLSSLIWLTSGSALLVVSIALVLYDFLSYKEVLLSDLSTKTEIVGQSASAALQFTDKEAAQEIISTFQADGAVLYASLHDHSGNQLATYQSDNAVQDFPENINLESINQDLNLQYVDFSRPIVYREETVGGLFVRYSLAPFYAKQMRHLMIVAIVLLFASFTVVLISSRLKRKITLPIQQLVKTSKTISERKDYSVRVEHQSSPSNELLVLTTAFNEMLRQIENRDQTLADHRDHLEELVHARTAELSTANANLEHAIERAEESSEFKSLILDNLTHEFRTPLNGIMGITSILREESSPDMVEFIDMIDDSGQRLFSLLTSLLNLASLDKQSLTFSDSHLTISTALEDVLPPFHQMAKEKNVRFEIDLKHTDDLVAFDTKAFQLLLEPLLSNAFKFTNTGYILLQIREDEHALRVKVKDTGKGIDQAFLENLFEPFSQESIGLTRSHEGAGVGMAIVKRVSDLLEGTISVHSEIGEGTTINISLPLGSEHVGHTEQIATPI